MAISTKAPVPHAGDRPPRAAASPGVRGRVAAGQVVDGRASDDERAAELLELGKAFRRTVRSLMRLRGRDTHLGVGELSHAQCELLFELEERGELSAGELAGAAQLTPATVTQMLDHLAVGGHVERARLERDRRVVVSRLTPHGLQAIEAKRAKWQGRWETALADMDAAELRAATRVLTRLRAVFDDGLAEADSAGQQASEPLL
jgi:DNA-binding MarR family transcriptional regulator